MIRKTKLELASIGEGAPAQGRAAHWRIQRSLAAFRTPGWSRCPGCFLLLLRFAFRGKANGDPNETIKKITKRTYSRWEWRHDDYSLKMEGCQPLVTGRSASELIWS